MARERSGSRRRSGKRGGTARGRAGERRGRRSSGRAAKRGRGIDFSALEDEDYHDEDEFDERDDREDYDDRARRRRPSPSGRRPPKQQRLTLMNLCTPVFGYAAVLPRQPQDAQPDYKQFRDEVLTSLKRIESESAQHGIEATDASQACYALCFFMDTQVVSSAWNGATQWATEPLGIVLQRDPEGGVNFFRRLEGFGDREKEVKEVFLVCLALGFRGKFAELEPAEQAARIGELRQQLVRGIRAEPLEKLPELFPEAYRPAEAIEDEVPRPPGWWLFASMGIVAVVLLVWIGMYFWAGRISGPAIEAVDAVMTERSSLPPPGQSTVEPTSGEDGP
jgi:type VI secretion system protein ImpK